MPEQDYTISVTVTRVYHLSMKAESEETAIERVKAMQTTEIAEQGSLQTIDVENIEAI